MSHQPRKHALVIGASRGLGLHLVEVLSARRWQVVATERGDSSDLHDLTDASDGQIRIEKVDMTDPGQVADLGSRLERSRFDLLFVNAAIDRGDVPIGDVPTAMFVEVMITNALSPLRVLERLRCLVSSTGTVAVMSSEQGSVSLNTEGGFELYKASKAALNQLMRSYATRHHEDGHTKLLIDPGHNRTRLGGFDAPLAPEQSIPAVVDVIESQAGAGGLQFLDQHGNHVPW